MLKLALGIGKIVTISDMHVTISDKDCTEKVSVTSDTVTMYLVVHPRGGIQKELTNAHCGVRSKSECRTEREV